MEDDDRVFVAAQLAAALIMRSQGGADYGLSEEEWAVRIFERVYIALPAATPGAKQTP
jgi:hypothetical protein